MNKLYTLLLLSVGMPALAATYTVSAGSSSAAIQAIVDTAGAAPGNTVAFAAGTYNLETMLTLPCANGTIYTGPNVGIVTQTNLPTAVLTITSTSASNFAIAVNSGVTTLTGSQGCEIEYLRFSGTEGGIYVYYPASGITIQDNAFDNNNPPYGGTDTQANIHLDGENSGFSAATGVQYISILWNVFFNNCASIRAVAYPDSGGYCAATWVNGYNNYLTWSNNTVNLIEEGLKFNQQSASGISSLNADVENNNLQGNSRIMIETQQDTNGVATYSHNAFYQPNDPGNYTFELSMPEYTSSISPTHTASDNVFIGNVPVTETASGASGEHYGIGLELWGVGSIATYNLFQGGNGASTCGAGWGCSTFAITVGEPLTNATITNNYFSGTEVWTGTANNVDDAVTYEDGGSASNPGIILSPNTVVQTSTTIPTVAPTISVIAGSAGGTVTLSDSDTNHRLSFFYTTDGTTPGIFPPNGSSGTSRLYTAPFTVPAGTTVKAIASWGQGANQGIVFPSFSYVPSSVVTTVIPAASKTLVSAYLGSKGGANTVMAGSTLQFTAYGVYSDGSVAALPDSLGNAVTLWNTNNHAVAKMSTGGHLTALAGGTINVEATIGTIEANVWTVTVKPASVAAAQAPPAAAKVAAPVAPAATPVAAPAATPVAAPAAAPVAEAILATPVSGSVPEAPGAPVADTFGGPFWKIVTPAGGSASISNGHLFLGVPGGSNHDPLLPSNQAVRVVQAIGDGNFDVSIKIDSPLVATDADTSQGLMVLTDNEDFITFALVTDGTKIGLSAQTVTGGAGTTVLDDADFSQYQNPMYLRLTKTGSAYVAYYSIDGVNWMEATSFADSKVPTLIGPFASNYNSTPANTVPVVMSVNWFDVVQ